MYCDKLAFHRYFSFLSHKLCLFMLSALNGLKTDVLEICRNLLNHFAITIHNKSFCVGILCKKFVMKEQTPNSLKRI